MTADEARRWRQRRGRAAAVRFWVVGAPVLASVATAWGVHRLLPPVSGLLARGGYLLVLLAVSTLVLVVVDRLTRRLLPLATLLELSLLFPDRAPSRLGLAREAIRRRPIEEQFARVRAAGADPGAVAREILTLIAALSRHDRPTRGHAERVRMFTDLLAAQLGLPQHDRDLLRWAAILHDIGKLHVPADLLNKPGRPTEQEWEVLQAHPAHGAEMAAGLLPWLGEWADVIVQHHERFDGTGYPSGLRGREICLGARIVSVADAYDVMTAARAYQRPVSRRAALRELVAHAGVQFDPVVVRAMIAVGVPRLRRAQGALAWLSDVPIVASGTVPAATLARAIGVGVLATGAVHPAVAGTTSDAVVDRSAPSTSSSVSTSASASLGPVSAEAGAATVASDPSDDEATSPTGPTIPPAPSGRPAPPPQGSTVPEPPAPSTVPAAATKQVSKVVRSVESVAQERATAAAATVKDTLTAVGDTTSDAVGQAAGTLDDTGATAGKLVHPLQP